MLLFWSVLVTLFRYSYCRECGKISDVVYLVTFGDDHVFCRNKVHNVHCIFHTIQCPFISQCKPKKVYFNPYIYAKAPNNPRKSKKKSCLFWSLELCLSLENICHDFLKLHRRRMTSEC